VRLKEDYDGAEPAPNSVAVMNLIRLDWMLGTAGVRTKAEATIETLRSQWTRIPQALPQLLCGIEMALAEPRTVVLAGDSRTGEFRMMAKVLWEQLGPRRVVLWADGADGQHWLMARKPYLAEMKPKGGAVTAFVCENFSCNAPVSSPADLRKQLRGG
jgi:uncharacterized protein